MPSCNQSVMLSCSQSVLQSCSQSVSQSVSQPINQSVNQSITQSLYHAYKAPGSYRDSYYTKPTNMLSAHVTFGTSSILMFHVVLYFGSVFIDKTVIPLVLVGCEIITVNSTPSASLVIYHIKCNARSCNNC